MPSQQTWRRRIVWVWAVSLALMMAWVFGDALDVGFIADDLFQISMLEGLFGEVSIAHLYAFAPGDPGTNADHVARGSLPWWTHPEFRFVMLRPLSSLLLAFDHWLWPRQPFVQHLHSAIWVAVMLMVAFRLARATTTSFIAAAAVTTFAFDETMTWMLAWLANRCAIVCTTFALAALLVRVKDDAGFKAGRVSSPFASRRWLELLLWCLAFSGGEYAVGGVAYFVGYQLLGAPGGWRRRLVSLWPAAVALMIFAVVYIAIHGGVYGTTTYIDPLSEPGHFAKSALHRLPRMLGEVWLDMSGESDRFWFKYYEAGISDWVMPRDGSDLTTQAFRHARFAMVAVLGCVGGTWVFARRYLDAAERRTIRWLALGSVLSLIPMAAIPPATRSLLLPNFGAAVFVGAVLVAGFRAWRAHAPTWQHWLRRVGLSVIIGLIVSIQAYLETFYVQQFLQAMLDVQGAYAQFYRNGRFDELNLRDKHVVVVATPGLVSGIHGISMLNVLGYPTPRSWHVLGIGQRAYTLRVVGRRGIELAPVGGPMHFSPQEELFRSPAQALEAGDAVDAGLFRARVLSDFGGAGPGATVFRFKWELADPRLVFLQVGPDGLKPFEIPPKGKMIPIKPPKLPGMGAAL